jgi:hypothetical protein
MRELFASITPSDRTTRNERMGWWTVTETRCYAVPGPPVDPKRGVSG